MAARGRPAAAGGQLPAGAALAVHPRAEQRDAVAELLQQPGEQAVQLEAPAAPPPLHDLRVVGARSSTSRRPSAMSRFSNGTVSMCSALQRGQHRMTWAQPHPRSRSGRDMPRRSPVRGTTGVVQLRLGREHHARVAVEAEQRDQAASAPRPRARPGAATRAAEQGQRARSSQRRHAHVVARCPGTRADAVIGRDRRSLRIICTYSNSPPTAGLCSSSETTNSLSSKCQPCSPPGTMAVITARSADRRSGRRAVPSTSDRNSVRPSHSYSARIGEAGSIRS